MHRSKFVVVHNELAPVVRDLNILVLHMIQRMLQLAINVSIPCRHIEQSVARKAKHSVGVSAFLVLFRPRLQPLVAVVCAGCHLTAFICSPDNSVLLCVFLPVSN